MRCSVEGRPGRGQPATRVRAASSRPWRAPVSFPTARSVSALAALLDGAVQKNKEKRRIFRKVKMTHFRNRSCENQCLDSCREDELPSTPLTPREMPETVGGGRI